jgi:hypothetical protein
MRTAIFFLAFVAIALAACEASEKPTKLPTPEGAINVKELQLFGGQAHQTYFKMKVRFPGNPALEHYSNVIKGSWVRCDWSPEWQRFIDGTVTPNKTVHQQMYMWINRPAKRTLMLANRYYSSEGCTGNPENDDQEVVLVEYMGSDIDDTVAKLKLQCPESASRSNTSLQATPKSGAPELER